MIRLLLVLLLGNISGGHVFAASDAEYRKTISQWRSDRDARLKEPYGWLSINGLYWLEEGKHQVGSNPQSSILIPEAHCGKCAEIELIGKRVYVTPFTKLSLKGAPVDGRTALPFDTDLEIGAIHLAVVQRAKGIAARVRDPESPMRKKFKGCKWYSIGETYRVEATMDPPPADQKKISVEDITGGVSEEEVAGILKFNLKGKPVQLLAFPDGEGLFVVLRDKTSGKSTYSAGRFLNVERRPTAGEMVTLDFNKAYNPPCAFNKYTTCPLAPKQNVLDFAIEAGEKI